jgi:hypothetical protein
VDAANAPRDELRESGDEVHGVPERGVLLEPRVVAGVRKDLAAERVIGELLQRRGSPGYVLSEGLSGFVIATIKTHRVEDVSMHIEYKAGEAILVDWAGDKLEVINGLTG